MKRRWGASSAGKESTSDNTGDDGAVDDYMSESFIASLEGRPDSGGNGKKQRPRPLAGRGGGGGGPPVIKSKAESLQEASQKLREGLSKPLGEENRGLKLLKLMGYREGQGLGRSIEGIKEPLSIEVASQRRSGLGVVQEQREREGKTAERRKELASLRTMYMEEHQKAFKESMSSRFTEKRVRSQLARARKTVETLDEREGRGRSFLWPPIEEDEDEEEGGVGMIRDGGGRTGGGGGDGGGGGAAASTKASAEREEEQEGGTEEEEEEEEQAVVAVDEEEEEEEKEKEEVWRMMPDADKLSTVLEYLRQDHHYCLYCGHQYVSAEEMKAECPGTSEDDH